MTSEASRSRELPEERPTLADSSGSVSSRLASFFPVALKNGEAQTVRKCSICNHPYTDRRLHRVWISLRVATDILPLLVNACSEECIQKLPRPADGYFPEPHRGGLDLEQPMAKSLWEIWDEEDETE